MIRRRSAEKQIHLRERKILSEGEIVVAVLERLNERPEENRRL